LGFTRWRLIGLSPKFKVKVQGRCAGIPPASRIAFQRLAPWFQPWRIFHGVAWREKYFQRPLRVIALLHQLGFTPAEIAGAIGDFRGAGAAATRVVCR
jgi:hypothetical protein